MAAKKNVLGLVYAGGKVRRPPLVGMKFFHERAMRAADFGGARPRLYAKDLISLLWSHFPGARRRALPRRRTAIHVLTPLGFPAVEIRGQ
jgi:hypothetical protein